MMALTERLAEQGCTGEASAVECRDERGRARSIGTPEIPVRRYGKVPPLPEEESTWEIESVAAAAPRTIGEYGGAAVFLAALGAAALAGCVLYLH